MKNPKANPTVILMVSAVMGLITLSGGVFLTLKGDTALGSAMIGAVIAAFFQHSTQVLSTSSSMSSMESVASSLLNAVESGKNVAASTAASTAAATAAATTQSTSTSSTGQAKTVLGSSQPSQG